MNIKTKIFSFVISLVLVVSLLSVSCFAFEIGEPFLLREEISYSSVADYIGNESISGSFSVDGNLFTSVSVMYMGYVRVEFLNSDNSTSLTVYDDTGLVEPSFEVTVFGGTQTLLDFMSIIERPETSDFSFYDLLFDSISDGVFGENAALTSEQHLTLTLISTVLSYAFILLPLLLVIGFVMRCFRL